MTQKWTHRYELKPGRWVFAPTEDARKRGQAIRAAVESRWKPPQFYFHLRDGGHVAALKSHAENRFYFRADIDDFFGRVNRTRVTRCLKSWFPYAAAREMASESVVRRPDIDGFVLPYGFVQSPILASLALDMSKLGSLLRKLHELPALAVTVYVDDIIVSGSDERELEDVALNLQAIAETARFPVSRTKMEGPASSITAFNIDLSFGLLRISEARLAKFRLAYQGGSSEQRQAGIRGYVDSVNPGQTPSLDASVAAVDGCSGRREGEGV